MSRLEDQIAFVTDERVFLKKLFADYIKLKKKVQSAILTLGYGEEPNHQDFINVKTNIIIMIQDFHNKLKNDVLIYLEQTYLKGFDKSIIDLVSQVELESTVADDLIKLQRVQDLRTKRSNEIKQSAVTNRNISEIIEYKKDELIQKVTALMTEMEKEYDATKE